MAHESLKGELRQLKRRAIALLEQLDSFSEDPSGFREAFGVAHITPARLLQAARQSGPQEHLLKDIDQARTRVDAAARTLRESLRTNAPKLKKLDAPCAQVLAELDEMQDFPKRTLRMRSPLPKNV